MKNLILILAIIGSLFALTSCESPSIDENNGAEEETTVYQVDREKIDRPGNQGG